MINFDGWLIFLNMLLEAVLIIDGRDLSIKLANSAATRLLDCPVETLHGSSAIDLATTTEDQTFWAQIAANLVSESFSETTLLRGDGSSIRVARKVSRFVIDPHSTFYVVGLYDQTDRHRIEDELEKLVAELCATLESTADGILVVDLQNKIRSFNRRFAELWDLPRELMSLRNDEAVHAWLISNVLDPKHYTARLGLLADTPLHETSDVISLRSGRILERVSLPQLSRGRPIGRVFSYRDISQRLADESRLRLAAKVFASSLESILVTDAGFCIVAANPQFQEFTGFREIDLLNQSIHNFLVKPDDPQFSRQIEHHLEEESYWEGELWQLKKGGSFLPGRVSFVQIHEEEGGGRQYIAFIKDLTEQYAANKRIQELAYNDVLTGLPNRVLLGERIELVLNNAKRDHKSFAVLFLDLDRFKQINDSLGHAFGDRVLIQVAKRIQACLRQADTAARLGGDEFLILLNEVDASEAEYLANSIIEAVADTFMLDGMTFTLTVSIGIALYPTDGDTAGDLIKNADTAMYRVKERGRSGFRLYQPQMNVDLLARMKLDQAMRVALEHKRFRLHYQPRIDLLTNRIVGAEALARWYDPQLGEISPSRFIPVAEESGFISTLGAWVLKEAARQAAAWQSAGLNMVVAVNVSALQFQNPNFVELVARILNETKLAPSALELELTESILIYEADDALQRLLALANLGVQLSIDDFGTGYSSLTYLKRFPIHKLKIDRTFVDGLPQDESDTAIVSAIINLGHALHLQIVAEGVETEAHREFLKRAGCDQFQGFLVAPGLEPDDLVRLIKDQVRITARTPLEATC